MLKTTNFIITLLAFTGTAQTAAAQPALEKDYSFVMEIPSVIAMESSPAHLYVLSDTEGMVLFRTIPDTLQWLYSSTGMEQRGNTITADIRFAYLFGYNRRLTVLEPTSVLGVYSSTLLPAKPLDAERIESHLYVAMGKAGLGRISLRTPASVDSTVHYVDSERLGNSAIIDLESSPGQLFVLSSSERLFVYTDSDKGLVFEKELNLLRNLNRIFLVKGTLFGSDGEGALYEIDSTGNLSKLGSIGEPVEKLESWNDWLFIKGNSNRVWTSYQSRTPVLWKKDSKAGNYITVAKGEVWLCEYNQVSRIMEVNQASPVTGAATGVSTGRGLNLKPIEDQVLPFPKPLLIPLELQNNYPANEVKFVYQSGIENATIKGNGFYWQPRGEDVGQHRFKIIATTSSGQTDSTSFNVEIRSFNAPPRFAPLRPISIPISEPFTLPVSATDPDGMNRNLVRYIGVDLPEGASIDEKKGTFSWTPTARQIGKQEFRIIATDQYGAAASLDVTIRVIDPDSGN